MVWCLLMDWCEFALTAAQSMIPCAVGLSWDTGCHECWSVRGQGDLTISFPDAHKVYELAAVVRERVIESDRSFLWPKQELWTEDNARALLEFEAEVHRSVGSIPITKIADRVGKKSALFAVMAADAQAACHCIWATAQVAKLDGLVGTFPDQQNGPPPDERTMNKVSMQRRS